jgi:hypothetical protein
MKQPVQLFLIAAVFALAEAGLLCSCEKSEHPESPANYKIVAQALRAAVTNWAITNNWSLTNGVVYSNSLMLTGAELMTKSFMMTVTNELALEYARAAEFVAELHDQDRLPGISKEDHGILTSDQIESITTNGDVILMGYPASRTFHLVKYGDTSSNNYTVVKESKDATWKLRRAWETDSNGQIIREWPVQ